MKTFLLALAATAIAAPALAQQQSQAVERKVIAERVCNDGATTTVLVSGDLIMVEYFSAPRPDGTVAGYEDAYDMRQVKEAEAQFDALQCPDGERSRR